VCIGAATLGSMMCNITGYSVLYGMGTALDSLLSQAYGAKSYSLVGLYAQRAMVRDLCLLGGARSNRPYL
jgi:MATE family multidrug resistance protein